MPLGPTVDTNKITGGIKPEEVLFCILKANNALNALSL